MPLARYPLTFSVQVTKYQGEKASPLTLPIAYADIISEDIIQHKITAAKWGQPQLKQNKQQAQK